jgi:hypothetical protein
VSLAAADFDGDGDDDLALGSLHLEPHEDFISFIIQLPGGRFSEPIRFPCRDIPVSVVATDLDGDGDPDIAGLPGSALVTVINDGPGAFRWGPVYDPSVRVTKLAAADLDGDGLPEVLAGGEGGLAVLRNRSRPAASEDMDRDGVPDECEAPPFHRGDTTGDGRVDITDAVSLLQYLFQRGIPPPCADAADADDDGRLRVSDAVLLILHLFAGGAPPPAPGPPPAACGRDPVRPSGPDRLGCEEYAGC